MSFFLVKIGLIDFGAGQDVLFPVWGSDHLITDDLKTNAGVDKTGSIVHNAANIGSSEDMEDGICKGYTRRKSGLILLPFGSR